MKIRTFALSLAAATLLSTLVYASDNTDAINSSFSSDNHMLVTMAASDPFVTALTATGWDKTSELRY